MRYNKYGNKKTVVDNIKFDSKKEAKRYTELKILLNAKMIKDLELQPRFLLLDKYKQDDKTIRKIEYVADFRYYDNELEKEIVEDVKGMKTPIYKLKKKWLEGTTNYRITEI